MEDPFTGRVINGRKELTAKYISKCFEGAQNTYLKGYGRENDLSNQVKIVGQPTTVTIESIWFGSRIKFILDGFKDSYFLIKNISTNIDRKLIKKVWVDVGGQKLEQLNYVIYDYAKRRHYLNNDTKGLIPLSTFNVGIPALAYHIIEVNIELHDCPLMNPATLTFELYDIQAPLEGGRLLFNHYDTRSLDTNESDVTNLSYFIHQTNLSTIKDMHFNHLVDELIIPDSPSEVYDMNVVDNCVYRINEAYKIHNLSVFKLGCWLNYSSAYSGRLTIPDTVTEDKDGETIVYASNISIVRAMSGMMGLAFSK